MRVASGALGFRADPCQHGRQGLVGVAFVDEAVAVSVDSVIGQVEEFSGSAGGA